MNVLLIPSWYPSEDFLIQGIFIKEQAQALCEQYPVLNIGVSLWGQNKSNSLLWLKDHFKNLRKIYDFSKDKAIKVKQIQQNLYELENPVLIWSEHILGGNWKNILLAHEQNFQKFEALVGKVEVIHAQVCHPAGLIAHHLSKKFNIPYLITEHMSPFSFPVIQNKEGAIKEKYLQAYQNADINIAVSPDLKQKMEKQGIPEVVFVPNLTNEDFFKPSYQPKPSDIFCFFTLARMEAQKDIPTLLYAIKEVIQQNQNVKFRIAGEGSELMDYQQLASQLEIDQYIEWLGLLNREEAKRAYHHAHAFVLASLHETFGVVFAEAIACGIPIIATRCGGPECIINEANGKLVEIGNQEQLANTILQLMKEYPQYDSEQIREDFLNRFSKKVVTKQIMDSYRNIISS